jgi:hypothetical protein
MIEPIAADKKTSNAEETFYPITKGLFKMNMTKQDRVQDRAIEVLQWSVGLVACAALLFVLIAAPIFYVDGNSEGLWILALIFLGPLVICAGLYLVGSYIIFGTQKSLLDFFQVIWGRIPAYLWFFLAVLYLGGIVTAIWELLSNLVFEGCWSCGDLVGVCGFDSVFERDACDDFREVVKAA